MLAKLGLLTGLSATLTQLAFAELEAPGVTIPQQPIVVHGNIATGGGCLATQDLAGWMVRRLIGEDPAAAIVHSIARVAAPAMNDRNREPLFPSVCRR
jgi:transcriptional regulator GlxA family with amidase domain